MVRVDLAEPRGLQQLGALLGGKGVLGIIADLPAWVQQTVRSAAGVPSGAPTGTELPVAIDTTGTTGGLYVWTGAAWVKGSTIP